MFCARCGHQIKPGMKFCTNCGAPASQPEPASPEPAREATPVPVESWAPAADANDATREDEQATRDAEASLDVTAAAPAVMPAPAKAPRPDPAPAPASGSDEPPTAKKRGRLHTGLLIATVCLLVAIAVGVGYLVISGRPIEATFGQNEPIQASLVTRIKPHGEDGEPMGSYTVMLVASTADGNEDDPVASIDTTPYQIQVKGDSGFTIEDFGSDVPNGSYTVTIQDEETGAQQSFPMDYKSENPKAKDEVTVAPPAPSKDEGEQKEKQDDADDEPANAYRIYYDKLKGYIEQYGEPGSESHDEGHTLVATGVSVAKLIDFDNDGNEELLVAYNTNRGLSDEEATSQKGLDGYKVEVWSVRNGKLEVVYNEPNSLSTSNGGYAWLQIVQFKGATTLETYTIDSVDDGTITESTGYWQLQGGAFKKVVDAQVSYAQDYSGGMHYSIDSKEVSHDSYLESLEAPIKVLEQFAIFEAPGSSPAEDGRTSHTVEGNAELTNETLETLKAKAEGKDSAKDDATARATAFVAKDVKEKQLITSYASDPSGYSQGSLWAYPQFAPQKGKPSKALQSLNSELKKAYDDALTKQRNMTWEEAVGSDEGAAEQILWQYDTTAGIQGDIASVRLDRYAYYGGAHGTRFVSGRFYNLTTGEEVPATEALGMSEDEIKQAAASGLDAFFAHTPSDMDEDMYEDDAIADLFQSDRTLIYRTDDAVVACFTEGSLGSVAFGGHEIVIKALTDKVSVGDDLVDNYQQPEE